MFADFFNDEQSTQSFLEKLSDAVIVIDVSGVVCSFNRAAEVLFGYTAAEVVGNNVTLLMQPHERAKHSDYLKARVKGSDDHVVGKARPIRALKKSGTSFPANISITEFETSRGTLYLGFVRDLSVIETERIQIEAENERLRIQSAVEQTISRAKSPEGLLDGVLETITSMRGLQAQARAGIFLLDGESTAGSRSLSEPDPRPGERIGLRLARVSGEFSETFLKSEAWLPLGTCLCGKVAESGEVLMSPNCFTDCQHENRFPDMTDHGHYIFPLTGAERILGVVFIYTDVEPQWGQTMQRLLISLGTLIGNALERVWADQSKNDLLGKLNLALVGSGSTLIRVDFESGQIVPVSGLIDTPDLEITSIAERFRCIPEEYHEQLMGARTASDSVLIPFDLPSGRRWLNITYMHESIENGRRVQYNLTRDVTHQMTTQDERDRLIMELRETSIKRSRLFGMVAHELRTPVAAISMMANEGDSTDWQNSRRDIIRSSRDLLNTIDDMRLLINPEIKRPVRAEAFTIQDMNASVASSVASIVASSNVQYQQYNTIAQALSEDEFSVDTYRVRVVITNIVKNACLHSQGSHVWMVSRFFLDGQGNEYLEWLVADNGIGIPMDQIDRLFKAGERGSSGAEGTGFGLYIAKSWIEEISGAIEYRPRFEGGSEFMIRVPLISASSHKPLEHSQLAPAHASLDLLLPKLHVLMVEDEPMLRMLGQKLLSRLVADVQVAENGSRGLEAFSDQFNLVLTDYFMPEMSGVDMIMKMREQGYTGVIIGISAATIGEQREEMLYAGADMVLPKPLNAEIFKETLALLIERGRFNAVLNWEATDA